MAESLSSPGKISRFRDALSSQAVRLINRLRNRKSSLTGESLNEDIIGPRVEAEKERPGLVDSAGRLIFEQPDPLMIDRVVSADPRIEYFPTVIPGKMKTLRFKDGRNVEVPEEPFIPPVGIRTPIPSSYDDFINLYEADLLNRMGVGPSLFEKFVVPFLTEKVRQDAGNFSLVGVRGTACSINLDEKFGLHPERVVSPGNAKTIIDILDAGVENGMDYAPMSGFDPETAESLQHNYRSIQWLIGHTEGIRKEVVRFNGSEAAHSIFPVLLVYDRSKFPEDMTTLPEDPEERKRVILKAYILDFPIAKPA